MAGARTREHEEFWVGDWLVQPGLACVSRANKVVHITPRSMAVLVYLGNARGDVVPRNELLDAVWSGMTVTPDALSQCLVELRRAFGGGRNGRAVIETIPKVGVRLVAPVKRKRSEGRRLRLAVLPFDNLSTDPENGYVASAVHEDVLSKLSRLSNHLLVISRTTVLRYAADRPSIRDIARELDVDAILESSVRSAGEDVHIETRMIDASTDSVLWSDTYGARRAELGTLPSAIASDVARALRVELSAADQKCLENHQLRNDSVEQLAQELPRLRGEPSGPTVVVHEPPKVRDLLREPRVAVAGGIAVLVAVAAIIWAWAQVAGARWAREDAIPRITAHVDRGEYDEAFELGRSAARYTPDDPVLRTLMPLYSVEIAVTTAPPDADVYVRRYDAVDHEWRHIGRTPLEVRLPRHAMRWRFEKDGHATAERATTGNPDLTPLGEVATTVLEVPLLEAERQPPDTVFVPGGIAAHPVNLAAVEPVELPSYLVDRFEVTNRGFRDFVDAGGYAESAYWPELAAAIEGGERSLDEVIAEFVDATGQPGPAFWEFGRPLPGQDEHPVTGVSWYEAAAYARFRNKRLPTLYHWTKAALPDSEVPSSLAASGVPLSNFNGAGPAPVGSHGGVGPYGAYDMHGNVREWIRNHGPQGGWVLGGGWNDPPYEFHFAIPMDLFDRSPLIGFRLMQELGDGPVAASADASMDLLGRQRAMTAARPVSDEVFDTWRFSYEPGPLNATPPEVVETTDDWTKERVTIDTGYDERMEVYLFTPTDSEPPRQALVYFGGIGEFLAPAPADAIQPGFPAMPLDWLVQAGRVLVAPIWQGSFDRWRRPYDPADEVRSPREWVERRLDLGRTIDYLETRPDIDASRVGYVGVSMGASSALPLLALEPRLQTAVLLSGGFPVRVMPPVTDPVNYAPRITLPVLMVNGRYDYAFPLELSQERLFGLLGTPPEHKHHEVLEAGHGSLPRRELLNVTLEWLDKYLGSVN